MRQLSLSNFSPVISLGRFSVSNCLECEVIPVGPLCNVLLHRLCRWWLVNICLYTGNVKCLVVYYLSLSLSLSLFCSPNPTFPSLTQNLQLYCHQDQANFLLFAPSAVSPPQCAAQSGQRLEFTGASPVALSSSASQWEVMPSLVLVMCLGPTTSLLSTCLWSLASVVIYLQQKEKPSFTVGPPERRAEWRMRSVLFCCFYFVVVVFLFVFNTD